MKRIVYYDDVYNDDFAWSRGKIVPKKLGSDYKYVRQNILWQTTEFLLYRFIATPLLYVFCFLVFGLKVKNASVIRKLKTGCFLYANHTNGLADAYIPTLVSFPKRSRIITASDSVSIPYISGLVQMLGAVALPDTPEGARKFLKCLKALHKQKANPYDISRSTYLAVLQWYTPLYRSLLYLSRKTESPCRGGDCGLPAKENI